MQPEVIGWCFFWKIPTNFPMSNLDCEIHLTVIIHYFIIYPFVSQDAHFLCLNSKNSKFNLLTKKKQKKSLSIDLKSQYCQYYLEITFTRIIITLHFSTICLKVFFRVFLFCFLVFVINPINECLSFDAPPLTVVSSMMDIFYWLQQILLGPLIEWEGANRRDDDDGPVPPNHFWPSNNTVSVNGPETIS